jgi:hypothetical protein
VASHRRNCRQVVKITDARKSGTAFCGRARLRASRRVSQSRFIEIYFSSVPYRTDSFSSRDLCNGSLDQSPQSPP